MEKIIAGRHQNLDNNVKQYIYDELDKIEDEYNKLTSARVVLDHQKNWYYTEVILHGKNIAIEAKSKELNRRQSVDNAIDKANKQLRKFLSKLKDKHLHRKEKPKELAED